MEYEADYCEEPMALYELCKELEDRIAQIEGMLLSEGGQADFQSLLDKLDQQAAYKPRVQE